MVNHRSNVVSRHQISNVLLSRNWQANPSQDFKDVTHSFDSGSEERRKHQSDFIVWQQQM